jgi:arginine decarboxylase
MFGGVPLAEIKRQLFRLRQGGKLARVKMLLLTNCTFDGIVYDPFQVMLEVLAIKPDVIFLWDEAWFAFARATPTYRRRTAMDAAARLRAMLRSDAYRARHSDWAKEFGRMDPECEATWVDQELLPDPYQVRVRVYATQSTHKTLTSLRQGSMIHVHDQDFEQRARLSFNEAYMTHTSTSPNYQILASLDVGRRQLEFEGYELVRHCAGLAMMIRRALVDTPLLARYYTVLHPEDLIPAEFRPSGLERFYDPDHGFTRIEDHWREDPFALDPTRITLDISRTGMDGDSFRGMLIDRFDIQINKTSRNTVLFMLTIGSTRGSATYLLDVLLQIAEERELQREESSELELRAIDARVAELGVHPPLPTFSAFHPAFKEDPEEVTPDGDLRKAFFLATEPEAYEHVLLDATLRARVAGGERIVSAAFVTPYPPGFPVLVPGQMLSDDILEFLAELDANEIHGYRPEFGLRIFRESLLKRLLLTPRHRLGRMPPPLPSLSSRQEAPRP